MRIALVLVPLFFISCSTTVSQLDDYESVAFAKVSKVETVLDKYQVFVEKPFDNVYEILDKISSVQIVWSENSSTDYVIKADIQIKSFGNTKIRFGKVVIFNEKLNIMEETFPISDLKTELNKFFTQTRGYIIEKRINRDDEIIFKINIGKNMGVKKGDILNIYSFKDDIKFLSQQNSLVKYKIGTALISDMIEDNFCWIYFADSKTANKVSKNDIVILNKNNFGDYLEDGSHFMENDKKLLRNKIRF